MYYSATYDRDRRSSSRHGTPELEIKDSAAIYETERIKVLQQERVYVQKKTFTKWCNSYLEKVNIGVDDLFTDLCDGKILMNLLVIISGELFGRPNRGVLRVQKMENVSRCLQFLATKVTFENIGPEDIVDGNPTLILGLIWTIILRFQIQDIVIELNETENTDKINAKDALLLWCQRKTNGYNGVKIDNFHTSWRNGLGFNALIHAHRPDLIDFDALDPNDHMANLNNAFNVAEEQLGIKRLLDPEDMDVARPDDKSVMTYVASYYHYFAKMKSQMTDSKRINNVLASLMSIARDQDDYESLVTNLLDWINAKVDELNDRNFPNSLEGIKMEVNDFTNYRVVEKPPKYKEKGNIEVLFFNIQAKLKSGQKKMYIPPEGKLIRDIESAWICLEKAEHDREIALREEFIRQEKLKRLAEKFERKALLRESWLQDMMKILNDQNFANNTSQVEAALKKHEAIAADIESRRDRFVVLSGMAQELYQENYHGKQAIKEREKQILSKWQQLLEMLEKKKKLLNGFGEMLGMFREIEGIVAELKQMEPSLKSEDFGRHLDSVENLLHQHSLTESQLNNLSDRVKRLNQRALPYKKSLHPEAQILQKRLEPLNKDFENTLHLSHLRKSKLEASQTFFQLMQDFEDQDNWITETAMLAKSNDVGKDLASCTMLIKRHEGLEQEMAARVPQCEKIYSTADHLIGAGHPHKEDLKAKVAWLKGRWENLKEKMKARRTLLEDALESHQYYADANEAESWMREKMPLVTSEDFGRDQSSAENLCQRHNRLDGEIKAFDNDIKRLHQLASLMTKASSNAAVIGNQLSLPPSETMLNGDSNFDVTESSAADGEVEEEWVEVPYEYEVEEVKEQEGGAREEVVERAVPQIKTLYSYKGNGMEALKGEVLLLLEKTNSDWWKAQRENGQHGYLPSNYVKEIEPRIIKKVVRKASNEPVKVKVKKTGYKKELIRKKKATNLRRKPSARSQANLHFDKVNLENRQRAINDSYKALCDLSQSRKKNLEDSILFFQFRSECDDFEEWMDEKEQLLLTKESLSENMEAIKKKYELLITDMAANSHRIDDINNMADKMIQTQHLKLPEIKKRKSEINNKWNRLNELKRQKEKSLAGASGIELFQKLCEELKEWIQEKNNSINLEDVGKDVKTVQALKRRHQNLEMELKPLQEKLHKMNLIAQDVRKSHPDETPHVNQREKEIMELWRALKNKADKHKKLLDDAEELFKFREDAKDLENRMNDTKEKLREKIIPHSPSEADDLLKKHEELKDDMSDNRERLQKLTALGQDILAKDPSNKEVQDAVKKLRTEQEMLEEAWNERNKELQDAKKYQAFLKDANQLESQIANQNALLALDHNDMSMDNLDAQKKRQDEMESALKTQEEKMKALEDLAGKMEKEGHPDSKAVQDRMNSLKSKLDLMRKKLQDRRNKLAESQAFQEFNRDADELSDWIQTKYLLACDESYRDLTNLLPKLQKHQALEAEVKANHVRLGDINKTGEGLVKLGHHVTPEVKKTLTKLNNDWNQLDDKVKDKGVKLRQAAQQELFNKALEDANAKLSEMERLLNSQDLGKDLRGAKDLLYKHQMLENEMAVNAENLRSIVDQGNKLAKDGHFDSKGILQAIKEFDNRFKALEQPIAKRRHLLEESLKQHQYLFDVETELQWIKDHLPAATSIDYGRTLVDAINLHAKHKKLEIDLQGHQPQIDKVLSTGSSLVKAKHFGSQEIKEKSDELSSAWRNLLQEATIRRRNLESSLEKHKYLSEATDVQSLLTEKLHLVSGNDFGRDAGAADNLLTKHKAVESEVKTQSDVVKDLGERAAIIKRNDLSSAKEVSTKQAALEDLVSDLKRKCETRRKNLEGSKLYHDWLNETEELQDWISEQMVTANSEEYGQDYEHLQVILNKFGEFQLGIEAGSKRFERVDEISNSLVEANNPNKSQVVEKQNHLRNAWQDLLEHVEVRSQKLHGAGELHRFNRDVEDALTRIQEKYSGIPEDLGKDLRTVQSYIKKHEAFENELLALEAQLQILFDDSERLQMTYPGGNAEHISGQQEVVYSNWLILKDRSDLRKSNLQAQLDYYWFAQAARNLQNWSEEMLASMRDDKPARDVAMATEQLKEHEQKRAEMDSRQETFDDVIGSGKAMMKANHIMADDIREKLSEVEAVRAMLEKAWKKKKDQLEQSLEHQVFMRDANQLESISHAQEAYLKGVELGSTPDQVETLMKKHEAFENVLNSQDGKLLSLREFADRLLNAAHVGSDDIKETVQKVASKRSAIKDLSQKHKDKLSDNLLYAQFNRDVVEAEGWIDERLRVAKEENFKNVKDLQEKMKSLKKHQAFEAEIMANAEKIKSIKLAGEVLLKRRHPQSPEIQQRVNALIQKWNDLLHASNERGKGLEEVKDILKFNEEVDKVEAWIREKELLVAECDLGRDYEHCLELQRKVNDVEGGITVDEERINVICKLADKLLHQGRTDTKLIKDKKANLLSKWSNIQGALNDHRKKLEMALEIHSFNRDVDDISDRINEKATAMSSEDYGKNLASIQALIRKQEELEKDMTAIHLQIQKMDQVYVELSKKYPSMVAEPEEKLAKVKAGWKKLEDLASSRKCKLEEVYLVFRFLNDAEEQISWCNNVAALINSGSPGTNLHEAKQQLQSHLEKKAEITGRQGNQSTLMERAKKISAKSEFKADEVQKVTGKLDKAWRNLNTNWTERKTLLAQRHDFQVYESFADQADQWMATKEAFLANEDLGDSPSSVDDLIKKHDSFTTTLEAQCEKLSTLEQLAHELLKQQHYASDQIQARLEGVMERWASIKKCSELRRMRLNDSKDYQSFLISIHDVLTWIGEKMQLAMDESYRDPFNLKGKIQKHQAFQAEVVANRRRVDDVVEEGEKFISRMHYASPEIKEQMTCLEGTWSDLMLASAEKKKRLEEAYESLDHQRQCDDLENWIDEVEGHLASEDHGKDVITVQNLLKKHQLLEEDIAKKQEKLTSLKDKGQEFKRKKHFMADELVARARKLNERYQNLIEPCQIRRDNLEDSLLLHTFFRDVEDELGWVAEKMPLAANQDLGDNLNSVLNLQKKHQALENEIVAREPLTEAVVSMSSHMIEKKHPSSNQVQEQLKKLLTEQNQLKRLAAERKIKLLDAFESQTFYVESEEANQWIAEKKTYMMSRDLGKDEDSVQVLLKKLEALVLDIENFNYKIGELAALNQGLVTRDHFDKDNIQKQQALTEMRYQELQDLAVARKAKLSEKKRLFEFLRESEEVLKFIEEKSSVAGSDDYGTDIEHVQILQQKFNDFVDDLLASEERISNVNTLAECLLSSSHGETSTIKARCQLINQAWNEVKELAKARMTSLEGAKKVHAFVRDADDAIEWMEEKNLLACSEEYGQDVQSVNTLIVKHNALEQDLAAIHKQVEAISSTAEKLLELIPDAREHIEPKVEELQLTWNNLEGRAKLRLERLHQMEDVQIYFDDYRSLCAWCNEMQARITSDELARDVAGAELLVSRHKENKAEIDTKDKERGKFELRGRSLISEKNFLAAQIQGKIDHLDALFKSLLQTWEKRKVLYNQSLDLEIFKRDTDMLNEWLTQKMPVLENKNIGDSIETVEFLIQKHEDFEKMVYGQEDRFNAIKRFTLLEEAFSKQKREEEKLRLEEERRKEKERQEELKKREQERILEERRKEEEQRKLQDIRRLREADDVDGQDQQQKLSKDEVSQLIRRVPSFENESLLSPPPLPAQQPSLRSPSPTQLTSSPLATGSGGLKTSDTWKDEGTPVRKKVARTESQKREKRQRTLSMKTKKPFEVRGQAPLPPVDMSGFLERKHQYQKGRAKATIRSWKPFYTVLCGQLICFFKDEKDYMQQVASAPPLAIHGALCESAQDYTRKKNVLRLVLTDGSEYLFMAQDNNQMNEWVSKIKFHAALHPALQLLKFDDDNGGQLLFSESFTNFAKQPDQLDVDSINEAVARTSEVDSSRKSSICGEAPPLPSSVPPPHSSHGGSYPASESGESDRYGSLNRRGNAEFEINQTQSNTLQERPYSTFDPVTSDPGSPSFRSSLHLDSRSSLEVDTKPSKAEKKNKHGFFHGVFGKNKKDKEGKK